LAYGFAPGRHPLTTDIDPGESVFITYTAPDVGSTAIPLGREPTASSRAGVPQPPFIEALQFAPLMTDRDGLEASVT
jgi:hypothetical protein